MSLTTTTALRTIDCDAIWCEDCITYGDACYDCATVAEMICE